MAQEKFHIDPRTGRTKLCRAAAKACGLGGESAHYKSRDAAREALNFELKLRRELLEASLNPTLGWDGYLEESYAKLAAPRGVFCPHCGDTPDEVQGLRLLCYDRVDCDCGEGYDLDSIRVELLPGNPSYRFLDRAETLAATWYHASGDSEWLSEVRETGSPFEAHLGTEAAAFDRALTEYAGHGSFAQNFYLYEVKLDPEIRVSATIARDSNSAVLKGTRSHAARYLNLWEDMASISLAVNPSKIRIQSKRLVSFEEAHRRVSLYNVRP